MSTKSREVIFGSRIRGGDEMPIVPQGPEGNSVAFREFDG
jgi:hypothetical protein